MAKPTTIPNLQVIQRVDPKLGEALQKVQTAINASVTGNRKAPSTAVSNPAVRPV